MLTSHALTNCLEFNISPDSSMTLKGLFTMSGTLSIFLMNASEANECVAPESISTYAGVLEIDSSPDITKGFPSASVLVSVNTRALAFSCCVPLFGQSLMKCPSFPHLKHVLLFAWHSPGWVLSHWFLLMILLAFTFTLILDYWRSFSLIIILVLFNKVPMFHTSFVSSFFFLLFFICLLNYQDWSMRSLKEASQTPATFKSFARCLRNPCLKWSFFKSSVATICGAYQESSSNFWMYSSTDIIPCCK